MQVLYCKWNGCAEYGMEKSLQRLGHKVDSIYYNFPGADYSAECLDKIQKKIEEKHYDFLFSQNYIPIVSKICQIYKIIYISWVMDSPAHHLYSNSVKNPCNRIFIFDKILYNKFVNRNPNCIYYFPLATCMEEWEAAFKNTRHRDFSADVSFLGSLYIDESNYDTVTQVPDYLRGYLEGLIEAQFHVYGYNFLEDVLPYDIAKQYENCAQWMQPEDYEDDVIGIVAQEYLAKKCSQLERIRISEALADSPFDYKLYTNSQAPANLKKCAKGVVGYYDEMPWVFRQSKINLNITSKGIASGLPLRLFDILGCGGFVLTNYQAELADYFEIGKELAVYESIPHLLEQVEYFLTHDDERREIASRGYAKVKHYYSYDIILNNMLKQALN